MKTQHTDNSNYTLKDNGILHVETVKDFTSKEQLVHDAKVRLSFTDDQIVGYLADVRKTKHFSFEMVETIAAGMAGDDSIVAIAVVLSNVQTEIALRQGKKLMNGVKPLKTFETTEAAEHWLLGQLK